MKLEIKVPLPPRELSANGREHWRSFAAAKKDYKKELVLSLKVAVNSSGWEAPARARISLHYCTKGAVKAQLYNPRDWDNAVAAFKTAQDAFVLSGVLVGDSAEVLEGGAVSFDRKSGPWVRVTIEAIG